MPNREITEAHFYRNHPAIANTVMAVGGFAALACFWQAGNHAHDATHPEVESSATQASAAAQPIVAEYIVSNPESVEAAVGEVLQAGGYVVGGVSAAALAYYAAIGRASRRF